jgi:hypothetical protein
MRSREDLAYLEGQISGIKLAIVEFKRGPLWHLRDWIARILHRVAIHIEPRY